MAKVRSSSEIPMKSNRLIFISSVRGCAAYLLAFLPRVAEQTVPKLKENLLSETDSQSKCSLLLALGMLLPRASSTEECLHFLNEQWNLVKDSADECKRSLYTFITARWLIVVEAIKFCVAASVARLYIDQKPPKFALDQLLKVVGNDEMKLEYHVRRGCRWCDVKLTVSILGIWWSGHPGHGIDHHFEGWRCAA